jgi:hypothetical protein
MSKHEVNVNARLNNPSGVSVVHGQRFSIQAIKRDQWDAVTNPANGRCGPSGYNRLIADANYPRQGSPEGCLIARIQDGPWFFVGAKYDGTADRSGELVLRFNDMDGYVDKDGRKIGLLDNSGFGYVEIEVEVN